jgi:hypothetical protein
VERVASLDSMVGWKVNGSSHGIMNLCYARRFTAGTGGGTDTFVGFWVEGTNIAGYPIAQGNASLYMNNLLVLCVSTDTFAGTSIAYKIDKGFADVYLQDPECEGVTQSLVITGNGLTTAVYENQDLLIRHPVFEATQECIRISGTNNLGGIQIIGGYLYSSLDTTPTVSISNSNCPVTFTGVEYLGIVKTTYPVFYVSSSTGVESNGGHIVEAKGYPIQLSSSSNCKFTDRVSNWVNTGKEVSITNSNRNQFSISMYGNKARAKGYNVTDAISDYNEFNCTGIDTAVITGGSANKLVINGTQVTVVGIAAAGAGHNVASGVMA